MKTNLCGPDLGLGLSYLVSAMIVGLEESLEVLRVSSTSRTRVRPLLFYVRPEVALVSGRVHKLRAAFRDGERTGTGLKLTDTGYPV